MIPESRVKSKPWPTLVNHQLPPSPRQWADLSLRWIFLSWHEFFVIQMPGLLDFSVHALDVGLGSSTESSGMGLQLPELKMFLLGICENE